MIPPKPIHATFEGGAFRPDEPVEFAEGSKVVLRVAPRRLSPEEAKRLFPNSWGAFSSEDAEAIRQAIQEAREDEMRRARA